MEVEDFILSNEDKLNEVDVGSKAPLVHDPLLNLKDSDDFGPNVVVSLSIDDIFFTRRVTRSRQELKGDSPEFFVS